jgi:hypothetical protein
MRRAHGLQGEIIQREDRFFDEEESLGGRLYHMELHGGLMDSPESQGLVWQDTASVHTAPRSRGLT